ncbi:MAG: hypothetical protein JWL96_2700 [Sphingomonas bacterium]|uniref:hypothetical protein n=1 Tax=Sphingomonas bacterium TaxID=1895847 RepID=UPI0026118EDF|nr:hypothetical protein [Sphingomonas bacterium]MDB5710630.1 hypothetical protein [Sphingomonas bacterium]
MRKQTLTCWLILSLPATPVAAQSTVNKYDIRTQSPAVTDRQLAQQLWQVFEHQDRRGKKKGTVRLSDVWLNSKPYAQRFGGLCQRDTVTLLFAPVDGDPRDRGTAQTPTKAYGIEASKSFGFDSRPRKWPWEQDEEPRRSPLDDCNASDWFGADSAETANDGYLAALRAIEAMKADRLKPKSCDLFPIDMLPCDALARDLLPKNIELIQTCETDQASDCYDVWFGERSLKIVVEHRRVWPTAAGAPADGAIRSVVFESNVVFADARID